MFSSTYSKLPPELVDRIIDYLHADTTSLQTCALSSRILYPAALYHLLYEVTLTGPNTQPRLMAFLLKSDTPLSYVRSVKVHLGDYHGPLRLIRPWLHATVLSIIVRLRKIKSLTFSGMWFNTHDLATMCARTDQIKVLKLIHCWFDINIMKFFRSFLHVECLSLSQVDFESRLLDEISESPMPRPSLKQLIIHDAKSGSITFFEWLVREELHSQIHTFTFSSGESQPVEGLPAFLTALRPSLLHLDLQISSELTPLLQSDLLSSIADFDQLQTTRLKIGELERFSRSEGLQTAL